MSFIKKVGNFFTSKLFIINIILIILFWVGLIWGTLSYFESYTKKGEEVEVPNLITNNINDINSFLTGKDLKYEVIDSIYNPNLLEGTIVYQDPMATDSTGLKVKNGRTLKLRVSKQTRLVEIPYVISKSRRFAETSLTTKGLRTKTTFVPSTEDQGSVVDQKWNGKSVTRKQMAPINSIIELYVGEKSGSELVLIPDLNGLTINEAENRLKGGESSLRLFAVCGTCENAQDSLTARIHNQTPVAGDSSKAPAGSTITVFAE